MLIISCPENDGSECRYFSMSIYMGKENDFVGTLFLSAEQLNFVAKVLFVARRVLGKSIHFIKRPVPYGAPIMRYAYDS